MRQEPLSSGEAQRIKIAKYLTSALTDMLYVFDEPSVGLHPHDTVRLLKLFNQLVKDGNTLVLIDHNLSVISQADYLVDIGPDAGIYGERILFTGKPVELLRHHTLKLG